MIEFQEVTYFDCRTQSEITLTLNEKGGIISAELVFQEPLPIHVMMSPLFEGIITPQNIQVMKQSEKTVPVKKPCRGCGK